MKRIIALLNLLLIMMFLSGCSDSFVISRANKLFEQKKYSEALEEYKSLIAEEANTEINKIIYEKGVLLYNEKEYSFCLNYMAALGTKYEFSPQYTRTAQILINVNESEKEHLFFTGQLKEFEELGFEPAKELLTNEPFINYVPIIENKGLYRSDDSFVKPASDNSFLNELLGGDEERYVYANIGKRIECASYAPDSQLLYKITAEKLSQRASSDSYSCTCIYKGDGIYECEAKYTDSVREETYVYSFDMSFENGKMIVSALITSEPPWRLTFVEGAYSKIG